MYNVQALRQHFIDELQNERFTVDKTGQKTIEMIGASFIADEPAIFGEVNHDYVKSEIKWYESQSTNIDDIYGDLKPPPAAWEYTANKHGEINSNYGYLIYSDRFHNQYNQVWHELVKNPDGRRAMMVYNRPSIWAEYNENGKNDFICTNAVAYYIRDGKMHSTVQMRSNDVIFGYKNDYAWQRYVLDSLVDDYNDSIRYAEDRESVTAGDIHWQVMNLHVYERHFHLVK
jgi:thymidylate synthase